jgi:hypothetical protein
MGLDIFLESASASGDAPSSAYPDHICNRRYLRSSYNGGGYNSAVPDFLGDPEKPGDLYWIFEPMGRTWDGDAGDLTGVDIPNLRLCRERALDTAERLRTCDPLRVESTTGMVGPADHMWHQPPTEDQVLAWYREEAKARAGRPSPFDTEGYSNAKGLVLGFTTGAEVLAVTVGQLFGAPAAIFVYRPSKGVVDFYVQAAEIVAEFCDEAIRLIEADGGATMTWSG